MIFFFFHKADIAKKTTNTTKEHLDDIVKYLKSTKSLNFKPYLYTSF